MATLLQSLALSSEEFQLRTNNNVFQGEGDVEENNTKKTWKPYDIFKWYEQEGNRKSWKEHNVVEKEVNSCFSIALLINDMIIQLLELNDLRKPNIGFWHLNAGWASKVSLTDQNLPLRDNSTLKVQGAQLTEPQQSLIRIHPERERKINNSVSLL